MANVSHYKLNIELTHDNAVQWFQRLQLLLESIGCWKLVTEGSGANDRAADTKARLALSCNIGDDLINIVDPSKSPKEIWDALKEQFTGVSVARRMSLRKMLVSFKKSEDESLDQFINRADRLKAELQTADMYKDEDFVLAFLAALDATAYSVWAQSKMSQVPIAKYVDLTANLRGTFHGELHVAKASDSQAYAASSSHDCGYCGRSGHHMFDCWKLQREMAAHQSGNSNSSARGGRGSRGRGPGRNGGRGRSRGGRGRGSQAHQTSAFVCISANNVSSGLSMKWLFDSATTDHMVNDLAYLHNVRR